MKLTITGALANVPRPKDIDMRDTGAYIDLVLKLAQMLSSGVFTYTPNAMEHKYFEMVRKDFGTRDWIVSSIAAKIPGGIHEWRFAASK